MLLESISLGHKLFLEPLFHNLGLCLSEYSFASRFLFRREYDIKVLYENNNVWLTGKLKDGTTFLMPTRDIQSMSKATLLNSLQYADCFYPIPESWLNSMSLSNYRFNRSDSDYLFKREKIANYAGRNLSQKRNLLKQFLDSYKPEVFPYEISYMKDGFYILNEWQKSFKGKQNDFLPCKDALELAKELELLGYIIFIDGKPAAFILGEILRPHLFVIHFAKALIEFKGIYAYLFQELANRLAHEEISCLNWEQDLGEEGLRKSKLSYQPEKIEHKYIVSNAL